MMIRGLLGKKLGMTQIFTEDGMRIPVTVIEVGPCVVQEIKTTERDGYTAVQLGYGEKKEKRTNKPQKVALKAKKLTPKKFVREIRCDDVKDMKIGDKITSEMLQVGDFVDVIGRSKGKGFQGGMKRHHWFGGGATHGSMSHRAPGSIGASTYPARVFKGQRMAGHMGAAKSTMQNLEVVYVDTENNTVAVRGAVPGANGAYVIVKYAKKKKLAPRRSAEKEKNENKEEGSKE